MADLEARVALVDELAERDATRAEGARLAARLERGSRGEGVRSVEVVVRVATTQSAKGNVGINITTKNTNKYRKDK